MKCPFCKHQGDEVIDVQRSPRRKSVRRRRQCKNCQMRFTTEERVVTTALAAERRAQASRLSRGEAVSS